MSRKPRKKTMDPRKVDLPSRTRPRKDKDWGFDEIARSKPHRR